ncbi:MAG: hypothetical protein OQK82_09455, partial [Candidatus Pacearchaeota archaeon]|nr:hypothetical protein [Candidatus Pacearchaeota archaeon]
MDAMNINIILLLFMVFPFSANSSTSWDWSKTSLVINGFSNHSDSEYDSDIYQQNSNSDDLQNERLPLNEVNPGFGLQYDLDNNGSRFLTGGFYENSYY